MIRVRIYALGKEGEAEELVHSTTRSTLAAAINFASFYIDRRYSKGSLVYCASYMEIF